MGALFQTCFVNSSPERNVALAQIFEKCPTKRFAVSSLFDREISIEKTLASASSNREKGNVIVMYALREPNRSLSHVQQLAKIDPENPQMSFLLLREINKVEDWVLTPKYNLFPPSMYGDYYTPEQKDQYEARVSSDTQYALEFANWLKGVSFQNKNTRFIQQLGSAYLHKIGGYQTIAKAQLLTIETHNNIKVNHLKDQIELLFKVAAAKNENWITNDKNSILLQAYTPSNYSNFLFAIAREAEYNKQTSLAACLFSRLNSTPEYSEITENWSESEAWKAPNKVTNLYGDFFTTIVYPKLKVFL